MSNPTNPDDQADYATSDTRFGASAESQAQIRDALDIRSETAEPLNVYRLQPVAPADDPRWQGAPDSGTLTVAARTAGDARLVAAACEADFQETDAAPAEDVSTRNASVFRDEKLYTVIEVERGRTDLRRSVLEGTVRANVILPLQGGASKER